MAKGKVVFTGAELAFIKHYNLKHAVCINAKPDVNYLVTQLSYLIENPNKIITIGTRAKEFIKEHHDYKKIAETYILKWEEN